MVQGGMSCIKYLMFAFNFVFVVCGITLIVIGAVVQNKEYTYFLDSHYFTAPTLIIIVGCVIFVLAFLGCCGAVRENHCMVLCFGLLLFLIFIVEIAGGITAYVYRGDLKNIVKENMNNSIYQNKEDANKTWDEMQTKWHCCGVDKPQDWPVGRIPPSCCEPTAEVCAYENAYQKGCLDLMIEKINGQITMVGGVAIGIGVVELIGVMFSWCLASAIKKEYEGV